MTSTYKGAHEMAERWLLAKEVIAVRPSLRMCMVASRPTNQAKRQAFPTVSAIKRSPHHSLHTNLSLAHLATNLAIDMYHFYDVLV